MRKLLFTNLCLLVFSVSSLLAQIPGSQTLYGVTGAGMTSSSLYKFSADGTATLIGPTGRDHVVALAVHPITCDIYAVSNEDEGNGELLKLDPNTGAATSVGFTGIQVPDMSFNSKGVLYAWAENCDACPHGEDFLVTINLNTGAFSFVGDDDIGTAATGLGFDPTDRLYLKAEDEMYEISPANGAELSYNELTNTDPGTDISKNNTLVFSNTGTLYTFERIDIDSYLQTINLATNEITNVGLTGVPTLAALALVTYKPEPIPTMQEWGLLIFGLLILNLGIMLIYRKNALFVR